MNSILVFLLLLTNLIKINAQDCDKKKVSNGKLLGFYYTDLNGNKIKKVTEGQSIYMVVNSTGMIGKLINIDFNDEDIIYEFKGKEIENQLISNLEVTSDEMKVELKAIGRIYKFQQNEPALNKFKIQLRRTVESGYAFQISNLATETSTKIFINDFNFVMDEIDKVVPKNSNNELDIVYKESIGNEINKTIHTFTIDSMDNVLFKLEYNIQSTRNHLTIDCSEPSETFSIDNYLSYNNISFTTTNIYSFNGFQEGIEPTVDPYYLKIDSIFNSSNPEYMSIWGNINIVEVLLNEIKVEKHNIQKFNDIAYYFEQNGLYHSAILILKEVIKVKPNRIVAYINLGDAYWGLGDKTKAKESYTKYVDLMKKSNISGKIPKRILSRQ